jgi:predicted acylesterase/phospholipase RssA/CRP-like cAMP-binding protein
MESLPRIAYEEIATTPIGQSLGQREGRAVASRLERRVLIRGEELFRQGDGPDHLYVVLRGRLCAQIAGPDGAAQRLGEIGPGELVGETSVLRGTPRAAAVLALEPAVLASLDLAAWQELSVRLPELAAAVARAVEWRERTSDVRRFRPDAAWICAWLGRTDLLAGVNPATLEVMERELMWETLPAGEVLVHEGDAGACMWFVVRGRLRASVRRADGAERPVGEIGAGECVGEMALLSAAPRSATVRAVRDSELLRLPASTFEQLVVARPEAMLRLARAIVGRLQRTLGGRSRTLAERTIALVAAGPDVPMTAFATSLGAELSSIVRTAVLDGTAQARQAVADAGADPQVLVLVCDTTSTPWTARCLRQADDVVVVARAEGEVRPGSLEQEAWQSARRRGATCHLVLLQTGETPRGTAAWLAARPGVPHHHVRPGRAADHARLARLLSGHAVGLALSGGGARGFAHIGVIRALHEAGVPVDLVAGTSMGAMVGALCALGHTPEVILDRCRAWTRERPWSDFTLPLASIVRGRRIRRALGQLLGDTRIEDLWLPFACVTANLTRGAADTHTAGPLARLVLASNSVPGLAPPVHYEGAVHVDGGVIDNLPVGALHAMGAGRVIAVDVGSEVRVNAPPRLADCPSGWGLLWDRLSRRPDRALPIFVSVTRALTLASDDRVHAACRDADLTLRPPLDGHASTDFNDIDPITEIGFRCASQHLAAWTSRRQ